MASGRLSPAARAALQDAREIFVSPASFYEIGNKVRLGKWPEARPFLGRLTGILDEQGGRQAEFTPAVALAAGTLGWTHRDPFDRIIAATAIAHGLVLVSADTAFDALAGDPGWTARIW